MEVILNKMTPRKNLILIILFISIFFLSNPFVASISTENIQSNQIHIVDGEGDGDFTTIQQALSQAQPGDSIHIYSGTYQENISIHTAQLTIEGKPYELGSGNDIDAPLIQGDTSGNVISIHAEETSISGLIIQNSGSAYYDAGISIYCDHNNIQANGITGNFYGIVLNNCSENTIAKNYILANTMDGIFATTTQQNTITENLIKENGFQGIFLYEADQNQITENTLCLNGKDGIQLRNKCNHNDISKNTIHSNNIDGIKCWMNENQYNNINNNKIYSNGWNGIHLINGEHTQILENNITLNLFNGIHIGESNHNIIARNTIQDNKEEGITILFDTSTDNKIYHNNFLNDNAYDNGNNQWDNDAGSGGELLVILYWK